MIELFKETDKKYDKYLSVWNELSVEKRKTLIETYWNVAQIEKEKLIEMKKNIYSKHTEYSHHVKYLYYNTFLALNLYIKQVGEWEALREEIKEISLLLWRLNKGPYAYSLFKNIGKDSRERKIILKGFHNNKLNMKECTFCKRLVNGSNYRQHYMKCYREQYNEKKANQLNNC